MINNRLEHAVARARELREAPLSTIYFIQCKEFTKIGFARHVEKRFSLYAVHNPFPVKLLASFNTRRAKADEDLIHTALESYHARGEWFKLPKLLLTWIKDNSKCLTAEAIVDKLVT